MLNRIAEWFAGVGCLLVLLLFPVWGIHSCVRLSRDDPGKWWLATPTTFALLLILSLPLGEVADLVGPAGQALCLVYVAAPGVAFWLQMRPVIHSDRPWTRKILPVSCGLAALTVALVVYLAVFGP